MSAEEQHPKPAQLDLAIKDRITQATGGRIHALVVELVQERVIIRGTALTYHVKQLALEAVLDVVGPVDMGRVEFNIQVPARASRPRPGG
ncbi:MAG TPA: hypothetical protein VGZ47_17810 [Gemmataceae bacterium]|jgi:hypothetical protein|nr:hypothetical protein [Gemmataceae bacterium]